MNKKELSERDICTKYTTLALKTDFIEIWMNSPQYINSIDPGRSNGVPHISTKQLSDIDFSLFSIEEQKRIVDKVDQLMALCYQLEQQLTPANGNSEKLIDATIKQLVA